MKLCRLAYRTFGEAPKYTYTGKELDSSGLMYYGARYYDPALSRFITPDTVYDRSPQGLNRYSYALNNPILYRDPTGHFIKEDDEASPDCDGCVTGPANNLCYHENFRDPDSLHFQSPFISEHRSPWRIATPPDGDGSIVTYVPGHARPRWEAGWGYQPTIWRTTFISRYVGEVIMALPFTDNEHNIITGEQYDPGPAFDARFSVYLDVALGGLLKAVSAASKTATAVDGMTDNILILGRGTPEELQAIKGTLRGRVINNADVASDPKALFNYIHSEMRKANDIIQIMDDIPVEPVLGRGNGQWARAEKIFIDQNPEKFQDKLTRLYRTELQ